MTKALTKRQLEVWRRLTAPPEAYRAISNNDQLVAAMKYSSKVGYVVTPLANYFIELAEQTINRKWARKIKNNDDITQYAILMLLRSWHNFDHSKSTNAYSYLVIVINSSATYYLAKERKEELLKEALREQRSNQNILPIETIPQT